MRPIMEPVPVSPVARRPSDDRRRTRETRNTEPARTGRSVGFWTRLSRWSCSGLVGLCLFHIETLGNGGERYGTLSVDGVGGLKLRPVCSSEASLLQRIPVCLSTRLSAGPPVSPPFSLPVLLSVCLPVFWRTPPRPDRDQGCLDPDRVLMVSTEPEQ